jgi:hypothetical protein
MSAAARVTPVATEAALVATLATTFGAALGFALSSPRTGIEPATASTFLWLFFGLFLLRVSGQMLVLRRAPRWLPPMGQWNLLPYRFLLPTQIALLVLMAWIGRDLSRGAGVFADPVPAAGSALVWLSYTYAGAMAVRYAVQMHRRPDQRWAGGAIPIVFHFVLAAFVFTFGTYHASH